MSVCEKCPHCGGDIRDVLERATVMVANDMYDRERVVPISPAALDSAFDLAVRQAFEDAPAKAAAESARIAQKWRELFGAPPTAAYEGERDVSADDELGAEVGKGLERIQRTLDHVMQPALDALEAQIAAMPLEHGPGER